MVESLWSALPLDEKAKYERKAEQNIQNVHPMSEAHNVQNYAREVEEERRVSLGGGELKETNKSECNWQVNSIAEQEMQQGSNFRKAPTTPESSPASPPATPPAPSPASSAAPASTPAGSVSSLAEENSLELINSDSQPYSIFYSELRQVILLSFPMFFEKFPRVLLTPLASGC